MSVMIFFCFYLFCSAAENMTFDPEYRTVLCSFRIRDEIRSAVSEKIATQIRERLDKKIFYLSEKKQISESDTLEISNDLKSPEYLSVHLFRERSEKMTGDYGDLDADIRICFLQGGKTAVCFIIRKKRYRLGWWSGSYPEFIVVPDCTEVYNWTAYVDEERFADKTVKEIIDRMFFRDNMFLQYQE